MNWKRLLPAIREIGSRNSEPPELTSDVERIRRAAGLQEVSFVQDLCIGRQGVPSEVYVRIENRDQTSIRVEGMDIERYSSGVISFPVPSDSAGEQRLTTRITYIDYQGIPHTRHAVLRYYILPDNEEIALFYDHMEYLKGNFLVHFTVHNLSLQPIRMGESAIPAGDVRDVRVPVNPPDSDDTEMTIAVSLERDGLTIPMRATIPFNRSYSFFQNGRLADALAYVDSILLARHSDSRSWQIRGDILMKMGRIADAVISYEQAVELDVFNTVAETCLEKLYDYPHSGPEGSSQISYLDDFPGSLKGIYTPIERIRTDRAGIFYLVRKTETSEVRVIQILNVDTIVPSLFQLQISVWRPLRNDNILRLYFWELEPVSILELEYAGGEAQNGRVVRTLADLKVPVPPAAAVMIATGIASGLSYLHRQGARHYYLHPGAVLLHRPLHAKIAGFIHGINLMDPSCLPGDDEGGWIFAPEQRDPAHWGSPGKKTDIYQLGILLIYLLAGRTIRRYEEFREISSDKPFYESCAPVLSRMAAPDKQERFNDMDEVHESLLALAETLRQKKRGRQDAPPERT